LRGAPLKVTAAAGLDALTHLIEGYLSRGAQPTTDLLARRGLEIMWRGLTRLAERPDAFAMGGEAETAHDLALASLWGGIVLTNAGLGAVHGLVAPLGGLCAVAHGDGCACLLPATFRQNFAALRQRAPSSPTLARYAELAALLNGDASRPLDSAVEDAAAGLLALRQALGVPPLGAQGVTAEHFDRIVAQARGGSMRSNPIVLLDEELKAILQASL
jgi:alcohol dehydrogenase class IV